MCRRNPHTQSKNISSVIIGVIEKIIDTNKVNPTELPWLKVEISVHMSDFKYVDVVADTGAQVSVCGPHASGKLGIKHEDLIKPIHSLQNATGGRLTLIGS